MARCNADDCKDASFTSPLADLCWPVLLVSVTGCHGLAKKHEANSIPQFGTIDASQPGELRKVSQSAYIIEPPDELEITVQPPFPDWSADRRLHGPG